MRRFARQVSVSILVTAACLGASSAPAPLLSKGNPVSWWFVFKFNAATHPGCSAGENRACPFGGTVQNYHNPFGQQFAIASSKSAVLKQQTGCVGDSLNDPVGATFDQVYNGNFHYLIWNDDFDGAPKVSGSDTWGHSKGMLAWNNAGAGLVVQVSTPSWPGSGSRRFPRAGDGNSLGCVRDNDVKVSQHFFALQLTKSDVIAVLNALTNASVRTDVTNPQLVNNGGPNDVQALVANLGLKKSASKSVVNAKLSSGIVLISKPSNLIVPPWQMVSALLGGVSLRTATWWDHPAIHSSTPTTPVACWDSTLGKRGGVEIATTGTWNGATIGLTGGLGTDKNHAKVGVSTTGTARFSILGDMNQQGTLSGQESGTCASSQDQRGGLFFVSTNATLFKSLSALLQGDSDPPQ